MPAVSVCPMPEQIKIANHYRIREDAANIEERETQKFFFKIQKKN